MAPRRILTAAHCLPGVGAIQPLVQVSFLGPNGELMWSTAETTWTSQPTLDLAVLSLSEAPPVGAGAVGTIPVAHGLPSAFGEGSLLQVAGLGLNEGGTVGPLRFAVGAVTAFDAEAITLSAGGLGGACGGDSGGPALARGDDGEVVVVGVLKGGTASCFGTDAYSRVDNPAATAWLAEQLGPGGRVRPPSATHLVLGRQGRCFGALAVWAQDGALQAQRCKGESCGWDVGQGGFRCVTGDTDPCRGISDVGACDGEEAVRCVNGALDSNPCDACGWTCGRSPRTGNAACHAS